MNFRVGALVVAISTSGCATQQYQAYKGAPLSNAEQAVVQTESQRDHVVRSRLDQRLGIVDIDGVKTASFAACVMLGTENCYPDRAIVLPGRHHFTLRYDHGNSFSFGNIWFDAEAGKTYLIRRKILGYNIRMWVEENDLHTVVGGLADGEPPVSRNSK